MKVNRKDLLTVLESVQPGLASKETIEQGMCFVLREGSVLTFNDEVAVRAKLPEGMEELVCAVIASPLVQLLGRLDDEIVELAPTEGELRVNGKRRKGGVKMEAEVTMPVTAIEEPGKWKDLPDGFMKALKTVSGSCGTDERKFVLTCVHIGPTHIEACDNFQLTRYPLETGFTNPVLLPSGSVKELVKYKPAKYSLTGNWAHFQDAKGLVYSCRAYAEAYPDLDSFLKMEGEKTELPEGLKEIVARAEIFSAAADGVENEVIIKLTEGRIQLRGEGTTGWYEETKKLDYKGPGIEFRISPALLVDLSQKSRAALIGDGRMKVEAGEFVHVVCTALVTPGE